ncbi:translocation/assembly module TamB domain-containing protein [Christiangramia forsetii]|uniref:Translocation and assembly module TamB C-terminal domain-containing protein n=2 Tax=Christiangramia forsetii TaxID=411153 RepID=A0M1P1_CHRFK|nr:translocation/assembly module TamB domain-containing protein [Christiangramia forsetii]GGG42027.1 hypothetical protein GCM10011532_27310 [Christiangramia forsetii]CAL66536.1 conserved hypothetical protein, secreted [Christiangramia forsetii KT0803]
MSTAKERLFKVLKITGKVFLGILILLLLILLFIRSPWGQNIIKDKFISSIEKKTGAKIDLDRIFIQFNGDIQVDDLYIEDPKGDTIIYSNRISANISVWPLIQGNGFSLNSLDANNVKANIIRKDSIKGFNYEFLMEAFASDTTQTQTTTPVDTSAAPMDISLGDFDLKDFDIKYIDQVSGIDTKAKFEELKLSFSKTDLQNMAFQVSEAILNNANISYDQTKPFPPSEEEEAPMPVFGIEELKFNNVSASYNSVPDSVSAQIGLNDFELAEANFNLKDSIISGSQIKLHDSRIALKMQQNTSTGNSAEAVAETTDGFEWPGWKIDIKSIDLQHNNLAYNVNDANVTEGVFDPNAILLDSLTLQASDIVYQNKEAKLNILELKFQEGSGFNIKQFNIEALVNNQRMEFTNLNLQANNNSLAGKVVLTYDDLNSFMNNPGDARLDTSLQDIYVNISDFYSFQPDLKNNEYIKALAGSPIRGNLNVNGKIDNLNLNSLNIRWRNTSINGNGSIVNAQDPEKLSFNLPNVRLNSTRADLTKFVSESDLGVKLPEKLSLQGSFSGNTSKIKTNANLKTTDGDLFVDGNFEMGDKMVFDAEVRGDSISLGSLLQNEALGDIQLDIDLSGSGSTVSDLNASLDTKISSFTYNGYEFRDVDITGELENGKGPVNLTYQDTNLDMEAQLMVALDSVSPRFDFNVYMDGADLEAIGLTRRSIKTGFELKGWFEGNSSAYELEAEIIDGVAVYNNKTYLLGNFEAAAFVGTDTTSVMVDNRMLDLNLQSNASPGAFSAAINRHFKRYITENYQEDSITNPVNLKLDAKISQAPILNEVFLVNLEELDTVDINVDFIESERKLDASVSLPFVNYYSSEIDSLKLELRSDPSDLNFEFAFNELNTGPLAIKKTIISGDVLNSKLNLDFSSFYEEKQIVHVKSELNFQGDTLKFHLEPQDLILNGNPWQIDNANQISFGTEYLDFQNFRLSRNDQEMKLGNDTPGIEKDHLSLDFKNFKLAALLNYLNPEEKLAQGQINGNLVYEEPFGESGILANMEINQLQMLGVDLNTLSLKGESAGFSQYDFEMALKGGEIDLDLTGSYVAAEPSATLDMQLDLNKFQMSALEGFSQGMIKNGDGSFSGNISLNGTVLEPIYEGSLEFSSAKFNVAMLNENFEFPNETLTLDNQGVYFDNFNIEDANDNSIVVNGKIITENLLNPGFDLDVQADGFRLLNSTEEDNDLFYGTAVVDVDGTVTGDLTLPVVNMDIDIKESTDFTYVVPETELQMQERDGIVIFVNKENPEDILSQTEEESYVISGYDIFMKIGVDEGATFSIIINEETGDKFQVQGEGDLIFNMYPNGRMALTGIYNVNDGFYEMSLYNLVKRRFELADGSRVSWAGDPFDAQLDVSAIYRVETSASSLMAAQTTALDNGSDKFRQEIPFLVYLNVDGELMQPTISFGLDMPESERGVAGGEVYGRVQTLNSQEQELNKQVFSLLVLNRFFPEGNSTGAGGGTMAVARDNLNSALSDQLNMLSSRLVGESGVQLNFNVDSFTDYQGDGGPQDRTQLDISAQKAFLDDRLVVEVGSAVDIQGGNQAGQEATPVIGNVGISYLLDEDGVWRIKGFSRSQYENVIDGQLVVSGIALIFTKEFNKFKNMFEKAVMEKVQKKEEDKDSTDKDKETTKSENKADEN